MSTKELAGKTVQVNDEGFMTDPSEWDKDVAAAIATEEGIADLTDEQSAREGLIGLQVHGVGGRTDPLPVRWRNIKVRKLK